MKLLPCLVFLLCLVACSGAKKETPKIPREDFKVSLYQYRGGIVCRQPYIMGMHGGVRTCRDSSGRLVESMEAFYVEPWGHVRTYYPDGTVKSERLYESMSAQPVYDREYYASGALKSLYDSLGNREYDEQGHLLKADTVDGNWKIAYEVDSVENRVYWHKNQVVGDSSFWETRQLDGTLLYKSFRESKNETEQRYDSTGTLYYAVIIGDSVKEETDYYPDGKIWVYKKFQKMESYSGRGYFDIRVFKEYSEKGIALRDYEVLGADSAKSAVCRFRNESGDSLAFPERRKRYPYSMQEHCAGDLCKGSPNYSFVDSCKTLSRYR